MNKKIKKAVSKWNGHYIITIKISCSRVRFQKKTHIHHEFKELFSNLTNKCQYPT